MNDYKSFAELLKDKKVEDLKHKTNTLNERQELIKKFVDRLNLDRSNGGYKPLSPSFYASKMYDAGLNSNFLLWWFWGYCNDSKNFSSTWWWSLNPKNCK